MLNHVTVVGEKSWAKRAAVLTVLLFTAKGIAWLFLAAAVYWTTGG